MTYHLTTTALPLTSCNDFLSEGRKVWPRVKAMAEEVKALGGASSAGEPPARQQGGPAFSDESEALAAAVSEAWRNLPWLSRTGRFGEDATAVFSSKPCTPCGEKDCPCRIPQAPQPAANHDLTQRREPDAVPDQN